METKKIPLEAILLKNSVLTGERLNSLSVNAQILQTQEKQADVLACKKFDPGILSLVINPYLRIKT